MNRNPVVRVLLVLIITCTVVACNKRTQGNEDIFTELEGGEGIYIFKIPLILFNGIAAIELENGENIGEMGDIEVVKLMMFDQKKAKNATTLEISQFIKNRLKEIGYEEFINISSGGVGTSAYVLEKGDYISDLMVVVLENESVVGIGLSGKLNFSSISQFAANVDYGKLKSYLRTD